MSAQELRDAAALMRERAEASAVFAQVEGWWQPDGLRDVMLGFDETIQGVDADAAHIAAADPTVMLAVADWLEQAYHAWNLAEHSLGQMSVRAMSGQANEPDPHALAVARAYLCKEADQ